ncbi:MAG: hypothetical protein KKF12_17440 [Proteobacteria bacterium]|nr:hypothetical protein [Desulfobacula sp.]MBU4132603.1 hypothetical protein [Pseudomonadota bacterium]
MNDPGTLIAVSVILLYAVLGPVVLFGVYVLLDHLAGKAEKKPAPPKHPQNAALWTPEDVHSFLDRI